MGTAPEPEVFTISCPCGASISVDPQTSRPVRTCPDCRQSLTIVVTTDPNTGARRIGILVSPEAVAPPKRRGKPAASKTSPTLSGAHSPKCGCGARITVDMRTMDAVYTCSWCGGCYTAISKKDDVTGAEFPFLIPVEVVPLRKEKPKTARWAKPKEEAAPAATDLSAKENMLLLAKGQLGAQLLVRDEHGAKMSCFCGKDVPVSDDATRRILKCGDCGLTFRIFPAIDPKSKKPMVILVPRGPASPKTRV